MKRMLVIVAAGLIAAASLSAQAWGARAQGVTPQLQTQEIVSIEGRLALINGMVGLKDDGKTYYIGGLNRLIGFVDGLKEGASVKIEGYAIEIPAAPEYSHLRATKLTFAGKDYDLSAGYGMGMMNGGASGKFGGNTPRGGRR